MGELLTRYSITEILMFVTLLAAALKGVISFLDWAWERLKRIFSKDYAEKRRQEKLEADVGNLQQLKAKTDDRLDSLQAVDNQILTELEQIKKTLDEHIRVDDERNADSIRAYILRFNIELVRELKHTHEDFTEVLAKIDEYERYCDTHKDYRNNRAVSAIANIKEVYDDRLRKHDFK